MSCLIIEHRDSRTIRFVIEGNFDAPSVGYVEECWSEMQSAPRDWNPQRLVLDLTSVDQIGHEGQNAIARMARNGAHFKVCGPTAGCVIDLVCKEQRRLPSSRCLPSVIFGDPPTGW